MEKIRTNTLPVPTFSWLGVNYAEYEDEARQSEKTVIRCEDKKIYREDIRSSRSFEITAENGKNVTAVQFADPNGGIDLDTEIFLDGYSKMKLVQVFSGDRNTVSQLRVKISDNAVFELVQLYIGGNKTVSGVTAELEGRNSRFSADIGCTLKNNEELDINYIVNHYGKKSVSRINADAVLNDSSRKIFKGTIDFRKGAGGSKGSEQENVLLLSEKTVNKSVPVILCAEEDVEGSHGAAIGRIDEEHIFYMRSRGIPEDKIYEIISRAKLMRLIGLIGDEITERRIYDIFRWCEDE